MSSYLKAIQRLIWFELDLIAKNNMRVAFRESHQQRNDSSSESGSDTDSDIDDHELQMAKIYDKYVINTKYDRVHPAFPHPTEPNKYILLTVGNVHIWPDALIAQKPGVSLDSPPSKLKYLTLKKKNKANKEPQLNGLGNILITESQ